MIVRAVFLLTLLISISQILAEEDTAKVKTPPAAEKKVETKNITTTHPKDIKSKTPAKTKDEVKKTPAKAKDEGKKTAAPSKEAPAPTKGAAKSGDEKKAGNKDVFKLPLRMPGVNTKHHDTYLATPTKVEHDDAYIVGYIPQASAKKVHHILIYGCELPGRAGLDHWEVGDMGGECDPAGQQTILWAWALDAPKFDLPEGVGFHVGKNAKINYIVMEVHYKYVLKEPDSSGVDVLLTLKPPKNLAGIYLFATGGTVIPAHMSVNADTTCKYTGDRVMTPFAYRTHTHHLGVRVSAWREREGTWTLLGSGDPQKPQMFYLMKGESHPIRKDDILHARCEFVSHRDRTTRIGSTGADEMCNFYMMYHMNATRFKLEDGCYNEQRFKVPEYAMPKPSDMPDLVTFQQNKTWKPTGILKNMGQVGGLSHTADNEKLVVFQRSGNTWDHRWFNANNVVLDKKAFIKENTILFVDPKSGNVTRSFGSKQFIMPHGVFVDHHENVFVTDVALHQVLKFEPNKTEPSLVLGTKFEPGSDATHFCKPTSVVVTAEDFIFVGDGYCNDRVVKFTKAGKYVGAYGKQSLKKGVPGGLNLVHDLAISHLNRMVYVADRENGQIHAMNYKGNYTAVHSIPGNVYALEYIPELHTIAAVNISDAEEPSKVMLVNPESGEITGVYPTNDTKLTKPHALTYLRGIGIFLGEIAKPYSIWKLSELHHLVERKTQSPALLNVLASKIPISFLVVIAVLAVIPIAYMGVVVVIRCNDKKEDSGFDRQGFQKLLRDYDSSDEEEDLVFKNSKIYR